MSTPNKITVLLADDHALVRQTVAALLKAAGPFKVIGLAQNGREAVKLAQKLRPDVILMDIAMPILNGLEATREILAANPAAKVLILSAYSDDAYLERMTAVGAVGFLEKQTAAEFLTKAIHEVVAGRRFFTPAIAQRMARGKRWSRDHDGLLKPEAIRLTARETEVVRLVAKGRTSRQIATGLGIGTKTLEKVRQQTMDKLRLHETADLIRYALAAGLLTPRVRLKIV